MQTSVGKDAALDYELGADCIVHAKTFFNRPDYGAPLKTLLVCGELGEIGGVGRLGTTGLSVCG